MYQLPQLPYDFSSLEPFIDTHTVGLHYNKHEQNYLNQLNKLLLENNYDYRYSLGELIYHVNEFNSSDREDILYNIGGVLNHDLYWKSINSKRKTKPQGLLKQMIENKYGSFDRFFNEFKSNALKLKGSGYTFLILNENRELDIINLSNQETPLLYGHIPLFNIDMWEHSYYLNYKNEKGLYIDNFRAISDFGNANEIVKNLNIINF